MRALSSSTKEVIFAGAHDIGADDMGIDIARRAEIDHLRQKRIVLRNQIDGNDARAQDFLPVIDVVQKRVDRAYPLIDALRQLGPFPRPT